MPHCILSSYFHLHTDCLTTEVLVITTVLEGTAPDWESGHLGSILSSVTFILGKSFNISVTQFPHLKNGNSDIVTGWQYLLETAHPSSKC